MQNNLSYLANRVVTGKWLMTPDEYDILAKQVDAALSNDSGIVGKLCAVLAAVIPKGAAASDMLVDDAPVSPEGTQYAAVIPISGILVKGVSEEMEKTFGLCNVDRIGQALDEAIADDSVSKVVLDFNSPGGDVLGVEVLARKISRLSSIKPIIGWTATYAASGAWWLMSQCTQVGLTPDASVGSVGVYCLYENCKAALDKAGIEIQPFSAGKYKMLGHSYKPLSDDEKAIVQADIDDTYIKFKSAITSKRSIKDDDLQGLMYEGEKAVSTGYADFISDSLEGYLTTKETDNMKSFTKLAMNTTQVVEALEKTATKVASIVESAIAAKAQEPVKAEAPAKDEPAKEEPKADDAPAEEQMKSAKMNEDQTVACPHCSKAFALDMGDEAKAEEPAKGEPKKEEPAKEEPKAEEPKKDEPKAQAVSSEPITMGSIFGLTPVKKQNVLQTACDNAVKSVLGIS